MRPVLIAASLLLTASLAAAQTHGIGPSVTSGTTGIPASVTSLGPNGFGASSTPTRRCRNCFLTYLPAYSPSDVIQSVYDPAAADRLVRVFEKIEAQLRDEAKLREEERRELAQRRSEPARPRPADSASSDEDRFGDHYLDQRENQRRAGLLNPKPLSLPPPPPPKPEPPTVLVFKDGHRADIHNYAIVGDTLWDLNEQETRKIALAELDLPATAKVNDEHGTPLRLPGQR